MQGAVVMAPVVVVLGWAAAATAMRVEVRVEAGWGMAT